MTKVKVFVYGQQRRQQQRQPWGYDNSSPDFRHGELKMIKLYDKCLSNYNNFGFPRTCLKNFKFHVNGDNFLLDRKDLYLAVTTNRLSRLHNIALYSIQIH